MGDFLSQMWSAIGGFVSNGAQQLASSVWSVFNSLDSNDEGIVKAAWNTFDGLSFSLTQTFKLIWKWIGSGLHWLLHTFLPALQKLINKIRDKLSKLLHPLILYLKAWKKAWDQYYKNVLRPVINIIQRIRSILVVFRLLHIGWATRLDNYLQGVENKIQTSFFQVEEQINQLLNWVNWIVDPTGLFQPLTYVMSAIQTAGQMLAVLWDAQSTPLDPATRAQQKADAASGHRPEAVAAAKDVWANGLSADQRDRQATIATLYGDDGWRPWGK